MTQVDDVIRQAEAELGKPYVYGDEGPADFDCSGLMQYVFGKIGIKLPRTADEQYKYTKSVGTPMPGDLIFYVDGSGKATHVTLYIGNGKMVEAPHTGGVVEISGVGSMDGHTVHYGRVPGLGTVVAPIVSTVAAGATTVANTASGILGGAQKIVFEGVFGILGLAMIGYGIYRLTTAKEN